MRQTGPAILMLGAIIMSIVAFGMLACFTSMAAWFVLRFAIGAAASVLWVCGEAWLNQVADDATRGRVVAFYSMAVAGGFALGPVVLAATGSKGLMPFVVSCAVMLLSAAPLLPVLRSAPRLSGEPTGWLYQYFLLAPVAMLLCALFAAADGILISFLALYGKDVGLSEARSLYLITLMGIGGIAGQIPIGWLADRVDRMLLAAQCTLAIVGTSLAMPLVIAHYPWNFLYMFLFGAVLSGIYTIALVIIGERFKGADLAAASALFGVMQGRFESGEDIAALRSQPRSAVLALLILPCELLIDHHFDDKFGTCPVLRFSPAAGARLGATNGVSRSWRPSSAAWRARVSRRRPSTTSPGKPGYSAR